MKNSLKFLTLAFLALCCASCATKQPVQTVTEYAQIPATFDIVPEIPSIPEGAEITIGEAIKLSNDLRIAACTQKSRYRELHRYATQGQRVLPAATEQECPAN